MIAWLPGGEDAAKAVERMTALITKTARLTALGLMLFVCGKLMAESTSLPDILGATRGCSKQLFRCVAALKNGTPELTGVPVLPEKPLRAITMALYH